MKTRMIILIATLGLWSCANPPLDLTPEYLKTIHDIYGGTVNVKQMKPFDSNEIHTTIVTLSNCDYINYDLITRKGAANNCAIQLYRKYEIDVGKLSIDIIATDSTKYNYQYEGREVKQMVNDYPKIKKFIESEIDAVINRDFDKLYKIYLKSRPDTPKEVFLEKTNKSLASFTNSYSKSQIVSVQEGTFKKDPIYVINSSIFDPKGKFANIYETMIKKSILE